MNKYRKIIVEVLPTRKILLDRIRENGPWSGFSNWFNGINLNDNHFPADFSSFQFHLLFAPFLHMSIHCRTIPWIFFRAQPRKRSACTLMMTLKMFSNNRPNKNHRYHKCLSCQRTIIPLFVKVKNPPSPLLAMNDKRTSFITSLFVVVIPHFVPQLPRISYRRRK